MRSLTQRLEVGAEVAPDHPPLDVLIVEDSPSDAAMVRAALTEGALGRIQPRFATTVADAVRALAVAVPDCVLLDLGLPDSDGLDTLRTVLDAAPAAAVIVLTGLDDDTLGRSAVRTGAQDYLVKGKTDAELLGRAVTYAVFRRQAERSLVEAESEHGDALQRSEQRLQSLIRNSSDIISVIDTSGRVLFTSAAADRILGYRPDELVGTRVLDLVHPDDAVEVAAELETVPGRPGIHSAVTTRVRHADGGWRWMEVILNNLLDDPSIGGIVADLRDVTEQRKASHDLTLLNRVLRTVSDADAVVVRATTEAELMDQMCQVIVATGGYALAWIALPDPAVPGRVAPHAVSGAADGYHEQMLAAYGGGPVYDGPATRALFTGSTQLLQDVASLPADSSLRTISEAHGLPAQLALPLLVGQEVIGSLSIHARQPNAFDADEIQLLEKLAVDLAYGIESLRSRTAATGYLAQLEHNLDALVSTIAAAAEARDPYIAGHQHRVALLAAAIERELNLDANTIAGIEVAGSIHDIGKIAIPAEILSKPGRISSAEYELIKGHVQAGYDIVKGVDFPWPVARMVHEHHERLDGTGYPRGLQADELLLGSRIIAVADVVEAMASHRPYRPALGIEPALAQITAERGERLDADAVDACLRLFRDQGSAFGAVHETAGWAPPTALPTVP